MHNYFFELKNRIIYVLIMGGLIFSLSYSYKEALFYFLAKPILVKTNQENATYFIYTHVTEVFLTYIKISVLTGLFLMIPYAFFQTWKFFLPGFYYSEQFFFNYLLIFFLIIWLFTNLIIYLYILPYVWFFFSELTFFSTEQLIPFFFEAKLDEYVEFVTQTFFSFSFIFQIFFFCVFFLLTHIKSDFKIIKKIRPYFYLSTFLFACFITPPDVFSQLMVASPLLVLYESILFYAFIKNEYLWLNTPLTRLNF